MNAGKVRRDAPFPSQVSAVSPLNGTALDGSRRPRRARRQSAAMRGNPGTGTIWQCPACDHRFSDPVDYARHMGRHWNWLPKDVKAEMRRRFAAYAAQERTEAGARVLGWRIACAGFRYDGRPCNSPVRPGGKYCRHCDGNDLRMEPGDQGTSRPWPKMA
jgi:uncharacterized C2H2 Zn-finger protein